MNQPSESAGVVVCVGAVVLQGDKVLMIRQAQGHSLQGQWSIPWGLVDPGESPESAALREVREESGITAVLEGFIGMQNLPSEGWIGLIFLCRHASGTPICDGVETDAAAYWSQAELDALTEAVEPWCRWIVERVMTGKVQVIAPLFDNPYKPRLAFL